MCSYVFIVFIVVYHRNTFSFVSVRINVKSFDVASVVINEKAKIFCEGNQAGAFWLDSFLLPLGQQPFTF